MYDDEAIKQIKEFCIAKHLTISVAESVTGGHVQAALSSADNALQFFQGGVTTYNLGQKCKLLGVEPIHAASCNCVSEKVAQQMAIGCTALFKSDIGLAITGYASPAPEQGIESPFAYGCIAHNGIVIHTARITAHDHDSQKTQIGYTNYLLRLLNQHTKHLEVNRS